MRLETRQWTRVYYSIYAPWTYVILGNVIHLTAVILVMLPLGGRFLFIEVGRSSVALLTPSQAQPTPALQSADSTTIPFRRWPGQSC